MSNPAPPRIFSRDRRKAVWDRAQLRQQREDAARFVLEDMAEDFAERIAFMQLAPERALLMGSLVGDLPGLDIVIHAPPGGFDEELPFPGGPFDFIAGFETLATVNDLPAALLHMRCALTEGGVAMASLVGAGSLANLRRAMIAAEPDRPAPRMHPLIDNRAATALLERAGFRRFVVDSRSLSVAYRSLDRLVGDLRDQALGNQLARPAPPLGRAALGRARAAFLEHADPEGRVIERFEILTLTGWKT
ncbi:methyltransferase [Erythrobacter sp. QSSC1-22B]|nr:methyltransferase [Erythrobacter sp. QSSC1-22B]